MPYYSERHPIPQIVEQSITKGSSNQETRKQSKEGIVREIDIDLMMDYQTAKELKNWLDSLIKEFENPSDSIN